MFLKALEFIKDKYIPCILLAIGIEAYKYHDVAASSSQNLANIVNWHNKFKDGIDVSVHFNANIDIILNAINELYLMIENLQSLKEGE